MDRMEKMLLIREETVDCGRFANMENIQVLTFHYCHLENLSAITKMPNLRELTFAYCTFGVEKLPSLLEAPVVARINLNHMSAEGLEELQDMKNLKRLCLRDVTGIELDNLAAFKNLRTLEMDNMGLHDGSFIGKLVNIRRLYLYHHVMDNLDFLEMVPGLHKFILSKPAKNEDGLNAVSGMANLKEFIYPVKDLSIYKGCPKLEDIGIAPGVMQGFEVFAGSKVKSFTICGSCTRQHMEKVAKKLGNYVKLYSYSIRE